MNLKVYVITRTVCISWAIYHWMHNLPGNYQRVKVWEIWQTFCQGVFGIWRKIVPVHTLKPQSGEQTSFMVVVYLTLSYLLLLLLQVNEPSQDPIQLTGHTAEVTSVAWSTLDFPKVSGPSEVGGWVLEIMCTLPSTYLELEITLFTIVHDHFKLKVQFYDCKRSDIVSNSHLSAKDVP